MPKILIGEKIIVEKLEIANNFLTRLKGLLGRDFLCESCGLLIYPCKQVHTIGMKFDIDIVFLSSDLCVLEILNSMGKGKTSKKIKNCHYVLELPAGTCEVYNLEKDNILKLVED